MGNHLIGDDLSVFDRFVRPPGPVDAGWDIIASPWNAATYPITLTTAWSKPINLTVPIRLWNARCLIMNGMANHAKLSEAMGRTDLMEVDENPHDGAMYVEKKGSRKAHIQLYGSDYGGTSLGPIKAVFMLVRIADDPIGLPRFAWWLYYGNSLLNKVFKEQVWGIVHNRLAVVETAYGGAHKAARLLDSGDVALEMVWNSARIPRLVEASRYFKFKTVSPNRGPANGEHEVELGVIQLKRPESHRFDFLFDGLNGDKFEHGKTTELGKALTKVEFEPKAWECLLNYGGIVKIYDANGSGTPPKPPSS